MKKKNIRRQSRDAANGLLVLADKVAEAEVLSVKVSANDVSALDPRLRSPTDHRRWNTR
jgi:hypothetical protein